MNLADIRKSQASAKTGDGSVDSAAYELIEFLKKRRKGRRNAVTPFSTLVSMNASLPPFPQSLVIPVPPGVNNLYATFNGRRIPSEKCKAFKAAVASIAGIVGYRPMMAGDVEVKIVVHRPRKAGDAGGFEKAACDAMNGIAYADDRQIRRLIIELAKEDPVTPRAIFTVREYVSESAMAARQIGVCV